MEFLEADHNATAKGKAEQDEIHLSFSVVAYIAGIFIVCSNILVIRAVTTTETLQTTANMYVVSLACTDTLVGVLVLLVGTKYLVPLWFNSSEPACLSMVLLCYFPVSCSGMTMCLIAVDRHYYIMKPLQYQRAVTSRRVKVAVLTVWTLALVFGTCTIIFNNFSSTHHCSLQDVVPIIIRSYVGVAVFLICSVITAVVYARIGWVSFKTFQKIAHHRDSLMFLTSSRETQPTPPSYNLHRPSRVSLKAAKLFVSLFGLLVVCWCPYFLIEVITVFHDVDVTVYFASMTWGFLNSGVNALMYSYFDKDLRQTIKKMLCCSKGTVSVQDLR